MDLRTRSAVDAHPPPRRRRSKYQCTNPKACVVGYFVKNSYKDLDSAHVEEDLTIQKVDFICSDGQIAVDPVTLRHDYGEISLEPEFSVKVANRRGRMVPSSAS